MANNWTYEETLVAFHAFCHVPFKDSSKHHPLVVEYASLIGRSPSAMNMKIGNIGRFDPSLREKGIVGLAHGAKLEQAIWSEDERNRTNPSNGLCLNVFFHKAYDSHLIGISPDGIVDISARLLDNAPAPALRHYLQSLQGKPIRQPEKFFPNKELLASHYEAYKAFT